jgi:hypothetical protein
MWDEAMAKIEDELKDIRTRIKQLERAVFVKGGFKKSTKTQDFKGATGGMHFLISKGYFRSKRLFTTIVTELRTRGYLYSKQAFQNALTRLSRADGPLVTLKESGKKVYAERK